METSKDGTVYWFAMWRCGCTTMQADRSAPLRCPEHDAERLARPEEARPLAGMPLGRLTSEQTTALATPDGP